MSPLNSGSRPTRSSEDIDLISLDPRRSALAADLDTALPRSLQRSYGRLDWAPSLSTGSSVDAATLHTVRTAWSQLRPDSTATRAGT
ncbi:hypothetical protein ACFTZB_29260 [Rhodococcus sp. NPDC057014]|uniref:hypothetical protein n=1 Tax=Rhodococcus sp. NPDC057014 TaxID=3346000 RepID=UPI003644CE9E